MSSSIASSEMLRLLLFIPFCFRLNQVEHLIKALFILAYVSLVSFMILFMLFLQRDLEMMDGRVVDLVGCAMQWVGVGPGQKKEGSKRES